MKVTDEQIISAILVSVTNKEAAKLCGLSEAQFYKRIRADDFKRKFSQVKCELLDRATTTMQNGMNEAAQTMLEIMRDEGTAPQVRLNAADSILRNGLKLTEQNDILQRLEKLEELNDEQ